MKGHVFHAGAIILLERTTQVFNKRASPNWTIPEGCFWYNVTEPFSSRSTFHSVISRWCCVCLLYAKYTYEEDGENGEDGDEECDMFGAYNHHQVPYYSTLSTLQYAKRLLVCYKKGHQGGKRRPAFKRCANAAQNTIRNRYGFHQNFVHNPQTSANIAMHMFIMSVCKNNLVVSTHHVGWTYV